MTTAPTPLTAEERAEAGGLAARLRALAQRIPFTGASEWWALRETYEDAMRQAADAIEATERERDEAVQALTVFKEKHGAACDTAIVKALGEGT